MARKEIQVHVVLDLGTPSNPVVAVYSDYNTAEAFRASLQAANADTPNAFLVSTHTITHTNPLA